MATLEQTGQCFAINTTNMNKMGQYDIKFFSEAYTLQKDIICDRKIWTSGEIVVKAQ